MLFCTIELKQKEVKLISFNTSDLIDIQNVSHTISCNLICRFHLMITQLILNLFLNCSHSILSILIEMDYYLVFFFTGILLNFVLKLVC